MNARISGLIGLMAAFAVGCKSDPTETGVGTPTQLIANFSALVLNQGQATALTAQIVDGHLTPLPGPITFAACNGTVATITADTSYHPVPNLGARAIVSGVGLQKVCVVASSPGLKPDTVMVTVLPTIFQGSFSKTTIGANDTVVIRGTSLFKFDLAPGKFGLTYPSVPSPIALPILLLTADSAVFIGAGFDATKPWTIKGINVTYAGLDLSLPQTLATHPGALAGDDAVATAPDITAFLYGLPLDTTQSALIVAPQAANTSAACPETGAGPCVYFKFTVTTPITLAFTTDWDGADGANPDVDTYACPGTASTLTSAGCFEEGGGGALSAKPENTGFFTYPAGTHYFVVDYFAACDNPDPTKCSVSGLKVNNFLISISRQ